MTDTTEFEAMERVGWGNSTTARSYADGFALATRRAADVMVKKVEVAEGTNVLDLCCGHGVVAAALIVGGAEVTGLDFSEAMINLATKNVPNAKFIQGDAMNTGLPDQSFDAITIGFGVPHFPDQKRGLEEAARMLKPGGRIAFSIWRGQGSMGAFGWLFEAFARLGDPTVTLPAGPDAHILVERSIAEPMLSQVGFTKIELESVNTKMLVPAPDELFDIFDMGAVRAASLLQRQPAATRSAMRQDLADRVRTEGAEQEDGYLVPAPSVVISAVRE